MIEEKIEQGDSHSQKRSGNHMEYLSLDPAYIDTSVVTEIGIDKDLNSILIWVNGNLTMMTINLGDFAEKTIRPLKRNLSELLVGHKSKQSIINSVITTINRNIEIIKQLCGPPKDAINNNSIDGNVGCDAKPDTQLLVELTSHKENPQLFFKNQYGEAYVAVRLGKDKNLEIMSLGSEQIRILSH